MATAASEFVVALDIGTARVRCLIAEVTADGLRVVGRGDESSRGVRRGEIVDIAAAKYSVGKAIAAAEEQAGVEVRSLVLGVGSRHVTFFNNRACVGITREERTILASDVRRVSTAARRAPVREDALLVGALILSYAVDDVRHVAQPEGMHGTRLEAQAHLILDARTAVENTVASIGELREPEEFVFRAYAAAEAVLEEEEKKLGVVVIDIGAGTTGMMIFRDGSPVFSSVVPVGGDHVTNDIAIGMEFSVVDAGQLKEAHAGVGATPVGQMISLQSVGKDLSYSVDSTRLRVIVECRMREIFDIARREILRAGMRPTALRAVLTGGTSRMPGIESLAKSVLGCPVRIGKPKLGEKAPLGPDMATAAGLLMVGMRSRQQQVPAETAAGGKFITWLRQLF